MLPLGTTAPTFGLPDVDGRDVSLDDFADAPALVVAFVCNHCPFVRHIRDVWAVRARELQAEGVAIVAVNSNDTDAYPDDNPEEMAKEAASFGYTFPYVFDETQDVAKAYRAACTPDFFVFDGERRLVYRGQFDGSRPGNGVPVTGEDLVTAVRAVLRGETPIENQRPSLGCNIKWRPGNEPEYTA